MNQPAQWHPQRVLGIWLFGVCLLIAALVVFGGFVRLTRSGLSIVEWEVVTGVVPPLGETAWEEAFKQYQQTPEFQKVNTEMTLREYRFIYYMEYFHRLLGRLAGLSLALPLFVFLSIGVIPLRKAPVYAGIALLFALQGFMGWHMVKSGLVDQPLVSHYRLTAHLLLALALFAGCFWLGLNRITRPSIPAQPTHNAPALMLSLSLTAALVVQIAYGGLVAGLKAGHVSNTFPLLSGYLIPPGLLWPLQPWPINLVANPATVHFLHRWFAFAVLALVLALYSIVMKGAYSRPVRAALHWLLGLAGLQIMLGVSVIIWNVPLSLALVHQAVGVFFFALTLFITHRLLHPA